MPAVVLDISRSISRVPGSRVTGIDRIELAYISHFLNWPDPVAFLVRRRRNYVLLDRGGMKRLLALLENNGPWDTAGLLGQLGRNKQKQRKRIDNTLGRLGTFNRSLAKGVRKLVPEGFVFLNVGHGNFKDGFQQELQEAGAGKIVYFVHDMIPLDFPEYCTEKSTVRFEKQIRSLAKYANVFLCNSADTSNSLAKWLDLWGYSGGNLHVVLPGVDPLTTAAEPVPTTGHPYFVVLGTIEPRKNHRLLLDIWRDFEKTVSASEIPHLYIVGARGWMNEDVFEILDTAEYIGKTVFELGRTPDEQVGSLLKGCRALLFPSHAEGFGYPLVEALQSGTPVVCSNLPSFREIAADIPTYLETDNFAGWRDKILQLSRQEKQSGQFSADFPTWHQHFHNVAIILEE